MGQAPRVVVAFCCILFSGRCFSAIPDSGRRQRLTRILNQLDDINRQEAILDQEESRLAAVSEIGGVVVVSSFVAIEIAEFLHGRPPGNRIPLTRGLVRGAGATTALTTTVISAYQAMALTHEIENTKSILKQQQSDLQQLIESTGAR